MKNSHIKRQRSKDPLMSVSHNHHLVGADRQTDERTDDMITIGRTHFQCGPQLKMYVLVL